MANRGIIMIGGATTSLGVIPCTTTSFANAQGFAMDVGTYSTTQGAAEGLVTLDVRPDLVIRALMTAGATEGTALTVLQTTSASAGGTTVTDADVGSADMDGGTVWCISGNNVGHSRGITAHTGSTSIVVTVPFPRAIAPRLKRLAALSLPAALREDVTELVVAAEDDAETAPAPATRAKRVMGRVRAPARPSQKVVQDPPPARNRM